MADDGDSAIIGRRSSDGNYISFREAVRMFATKEELAGMHVSLNAVADRIEKLVPRTEHELHWHIEEDRSAELSARLALLANSVEQINENRLPRWSLPFIVAVSPIIAVIAAHYWK